MNFFKVATSTFLAVSFTLSATELLAESKVKILDACERPGFNTSSEEAKSILAEIMSWDAIYSPNYISRANACASKILKKPVAYIDGVGFTTDKNAAAEAIEAQRIEDARRMKNQEDVAAWNKRRETFTTKDYKSQVHTELCEVVSEIKRVKEIIEEYEQESENLKADVFWETYEVCSNDYKRAPESTLLNPTCNHIFMEIGLPTAERSGPSWTEKNMAENLMGALVNKKEIMEATGLLLEDSIEMVRIENLNADEQACD